MRKMQRTGRMETWLDGLGEWSWPGSPARAPAVELVPAAWVPALPLRAPAPLPGLSVRPRARRQTLPRPLRLARLALLLAVGGATFALSSGVVRFGAAPSGSAAAATLHLGPRPLAEDPFAATAAPSATAPPSLAAPRAAATSTALPATLSPGGAAARTRAASPGAPRLLERSAPAVDVRVPPPVPVAIETDAAGSTIARITYPSHALGWTDTYLVYLPPGYAAAGTRRYPVLYLLHGDTQPASSFLRLGLQATLDRLIRTRAIAPMIAVMLQADGLPNNWRNTSGPRYADYVDEVARVTDAALRTIPERASRGIAGYSMGGFGAMEIALSRLSEYSVVESWEGFFNNLSHQLAVDRPLLAHMPLHALVWGGLQDTIASSAEDAPWAAAMRAAGADATSAAYPGGHTFGPLEAHLAQMLTFAGRLLRS